MLSDRSHDQFHTVQGSLQIKQDDKFFSRLMSKETSMANSSCRVYYGGVSGAVPFTWESQPGTPKHPSSDTTLPPLTPPPSYHSSCGSKSKQKKIKPTLFSSIFPRMMNGGKNQGSPSSSSTSSSSISSSSSLSSWTLSSSSAPYSIARNLHRRTYFPCSRSPVHNCMVEFEEDDGIMSPTSTLCFGVKRRNLNELRGSQSMGKMKKALLSIVSHGSGQGTA